jgi:hypothetical protein
LDRIELGKKLSRRQEKEELVNRNILKGEHSLEIVVENGW